MAPEDEGIAAAAAARVDWLPRIDVVLDASVGRVWPLILHWERWIMDYRVEHVSGARDQPGQIKRVSQLAEDGTTAGYFLVEIVRLEVNERLVYRFLPLPEPAFGVERITGYEIFNLMQVGAKCLVTYETVAQLETTRLTQELFSENWRGAQVAGARAWADRYIPELKKLLARD